MEREPVVVSILTDSVSQWTLYITVRSRRFQHRRRYGYRKWVAQTPFLLIPNAMLFIVDEKLLTESIAVNAVSSQGNSMLSWTLIFIAISQTPFQIEIELPATVDFP